MTQLSVHTLGAVVKPADALLVIVPKDEELIVEAAVLNKDIGFVRAGEPAEVKLDAFTFTRYGVIDGTIETISRDSVEHKELGLVFPCLVSLALRRGRSHRPRAGLRRDCRDQDSVNVAPLSSSRC